MQTALVVFEDPDLRTLGIARQVANAGGQPLIVICLSKDQRDQVEPVLARSEALPSLVNHTIEVLDAAVETNPEVLDCRGSNLRRVLNDACAERGVEQLVVALERTQRGSSMYTLKRQIARATPVHTLTIDPGMVTKAQRVLIPQTSGGGRDAIQYASKYLNGEGAPIVVVPDRESIGRSARVYLNTTRRIAEAKRRSLTHHETELPLDEAVRELLGDDDLVLASVQSARELEQAREMLTGWSESCGDRRVAFAIFRDENAASPGWLERLFERARAHAPRLDRESRRSLVERLDRGGRITPDFVVMMMLSTAIASLGLIQSSAAVVIGAMLVAPLMTPLVAIGLSLVQANTMLFRKAARAMLAGIIGALIVSMIIGSLSPWSELSSEVLARGGPNVFDLAIALLSGIAAAYALSRPGLAGTLVGVAIAVALVPPLASVGIATVKGHLDVALGAGLLFVTNLFAIIVGAAIVFRIFGLDASLRGSRSPAWVRAVVLTILIGLLPVCALLIHNLKGQLHQGVHRPYARPLPADIRQQIRSRIARSEGVELIAMSQSELEDDFGVQVVLLCYDPERLDPNLESDLLDLIAFEFGTDTPSSVRVLQGVLP